MEVTCNKIAHKHTLVLPNKVQHATSSVYCMCPSAAWPHPHSAVTGLSDDFTSNHFTNWSALSGHHCSWGVFCEKKPPWARVWPLSEWLCRGSSSKGTIPYFNDSIHAVFIWGLLQGSHTCDVLIHIIKQECEASHFPPRHVLSFPALSSRTCYNYVSSTGWTDVLTVGW